jgi:hypothetical protein
LARQARRKSGNRGEDAASTASRILPEGSEIPRIAALRRIGSAAVRGVIDLHHALSQDGNINEVDDLVFFQAAG